MNRLSESGLGCHIGHISYSCLGYADDVGMLSPSIQAMQDLLHICEKFAKEYNILFNAKKTVCMHIGGSGNIPPRGLKLYGSLLAWSRRVKHLGNILTRDLSDCDDI